MLTLVFLSLALAASQVSCNLAGTHVVSPFNHRDLVVRQSGPTIPRASETPERCVGACSTMQNRYTTCDAYDSCLCSSTLAKNLNDCVNCLIYTILVENVIGEGQGVLDFYRYTCNDTGFPVPELTAKAVDAVGDGPTSTPGVAMDPFRHTTIITSPSGSIKSGSEKNGGIANYASFGLAIATITRGATLFL